MKKIILFFILLWAVDCEAQGKWYGMGIPKRDGIVSAICPDTVNNILYAGGGFDSVGGPGIHYLLKWDGNTWDTTFYIPNTQGYVDALIMYHGKLYMGLNGDSTGAVLSYDGNTNTNLGTFDGAVYCLAVYHDTLFAGGSFGENYGDSLYNIAKWDGSKWLPVDSGFWLYYTCCWRVSAMTVYNDQLIAAGTFDHAGGNWAYGIAAYNGITWQPLENGLGDDTSKSASGGDVTALEVYNGNLYAGGGFITVNDTITTYGLAVWNGSQWDSAAYHLYGNANALKSFDGYLFIGGDAGLEQQYLYKYDGINVSKVDSGVSSDVLSLNSWGNSLYVGGQFDTVGKTVFAQGIARWEPNSAGINQLSATNNSIIIYPNPFSSETTLQFSQQPTTNCQLTLYDLTGREVENYFISNGTTSIIIKRNNLPAGMYFYKTACGNGPVITGKVVAE